MTAWVAAKAPASGKWISPSPEVGIHSNEEGRAHAGGGFATVSLWETDGAKEEGAANVVALRDVGAPERDSSRHEEAG